MIVIYKKFINFIITFKVLLKNLFYKYRVFNIYKVTF